MITVPCPDTSVPINLSIFTSIVSATFCIVATTGNFLICLAVYKDPEKKLRKPYMFMITNLAFIDLMVGAVVLPVAVVTHSLEASADREGQFYKTLLIVARMLFFITATARTSTLIAFCTDRLLFIHYPIRYRRFATRRSYACAVVGIWLLSAAITNLYFAVTYICFLFVFAHFAILFVLALSVITCYLLKLLKKKAKKRQAMTHSFTTPPRLNKSFTALLLVFLVTFLACNIPAIVMMYLIKFYTTLDCSVRHIVRDLLYLFMLSNSAFNPWVSTLRLKPVYRALKMIFGLT
ncbi:adenosine receptor A1-like [Clytia hemisphaerica]|uniref:adenosine receptor A1-like n=1 Tax=Clytia hemisphaerica TaxID=252671 RepID=UPI0034D5FB8A